MKTSYTHAEVDQLLATLCASFSGTQAGFEEQAKHWDKIGDVGKRIEALSRAIQANECGRVIAQQRLVLMEQQR